MSERRIQLVTDDGCTIELTWAKGAKFTLEVDERPAVRPTVIECVPPNLTDEQREALKRAFDGVTGMGSSAGTVKEEPVSPEPPGSTTPQGDGNG